ncbi:hypothetical protein OPV22_019063 [Ensete ventricosum]|uniref:Uncharacterized protein n=1 Tax=Ensete ventricosum TaxID=4639 RepID=A0AAV8R014_ENSVE|nr:hypothetical protein OPV22_019063 [Ensete ventricosum]
MSRVSACRVSCTTALSLHSPLFRNSHRSSVRATVHRCPPARSLQRGESEKTCRPSLALKGEQDLTYSLSKPNLAPIKRKPIRGNLDKEETAVSWGRRGMLQRVENKDCAICSLWIRVDDTFARTGSTSDGVGVAL